MGKNPGRFLHFRQRSEVFPNVFPIKIRGPLTDQNPAKIQTILWTIREGLHDDQVFGGADPEPGTWF